jgi:hypothetical protein
MKESDKIELEHRVNLYQFYIDQYTKGIAFFLAITGALLKFAIDSKNYRTIFSAIGILCSLAVLIPLLFGFNHESSMSKDFGRLAQNTGTKKISTTPLKMLAIATAIFWIIVFLGWLYLMIFLK